MPDMKNAQEKATGRREGFLNAGDAARHLGVPRRTVYYYAHQGMLEHVRMGKRMLFTKSGLLEGASTSQKKD